MWGLVLLLVSELWVAYASTGQDLLDRRAAREMNWGTGRVAFSQPKQLWARYLVHLERSPVLTKTATSCVAALLGDALAQRAGRRGDKEWRYDWARTARLTLFQGLLMGPLGHLYYKNLDGRVMPESAKSAPAVAAKVVIDQLVFAPLATVVFYTYKCYSEGRSGQLRRELQEKYVPTMIANWKLWPAAHIINFAFVPPEQRILYANVVSVLGVYILSRAAAGDYSSGAGAASKPRSLVRARSQQHVREGGGGGGALASLAATAGAVQQGQLAQRAAAPTVQRAGSVQQHVQEEGAVLAHAHSGMRDVEVKLE